VNWPALFILVVLLAPVLWFAFRGQYVFVVRVRAGRPRGARGKVTDDFLREVGEVFRQHGLTRGAVRSVARGRLIALAFSGNVPPSCRQRLRNFWAMYGWPAKPSDGRREAPRNR
jgi:hypothetical protein